MKFELRVHWHPATGAAQKRKVYSFFGFRAKEYTSARPLTLPEREKCILSSKYR